MNESEKFAKLEYLYDQYGKEVINDKFTNLVNVGGVSKEMAISLIYYEIPDVKRLIKEENITIAEAIDRYIASLEEKAKQANPYKQTVIKPVHDSTRGYVNALILCLIAQVAVFGLLMVILLIIK